MSRLVDPVGAAFDELVDYQAEIVSLGYILKLGKCGILAGFEMVHDISWVVQNWHRTSPIAGAPSLHRRFVFANRIFSKVLIVFIDTPSPNLDKSILSWTPTAMFSTL